MEFAYTGIRVKNLSKSIKFYTNVMDMKVIERGKMTHGGVYVHLKSKIQRRNPPQNLELNWYPKNNTYYTKYEQGEELDHLAFDVDDVVGVFERLKKQGVKVAVKPFEDEGWVLAFVKDPNGIWIELIGRSKRKHRLLERE